MFFRKKVWDSANNEGAGVTSAHTKNEQQQLLRILFMRKSS